MSEWNTEIAEWYAENYGDYDTNRLGIEALALEAHSTIVDIGCGTGCALRHAAKHVTHGQLIGIDPVPRMTEIAQEQTAQHSAANRIMYYEGSAENLPIADAFADVVLAFDSYDHWHNKPKGLEEVRRVLKPNGRFVVVKDGELPNATDAKKEFVTTLMDADFTITEENIIEEGEVTCTQWVCAMG